MKTLMPSLLLSLGLLGHTSIASSADLTIKVSDLRNLKGSIQLAMYDNENDFKHDSVQHVFMAFTSKVTSTHMSYTLHGVPEGSYAVTVIHDENNNQELDMSGRTPLEGLAYSGTKSKLTKPSFHRASTKIQKENQTIQLKLNYYN